MELGKRNELKHYIIVEVRENPDRKYGTDAGDIRKVIHEYTKERGLNCADMIYREDRRKLPGGVYNPYPQIKEIYESSIAAMKEKWRIHGR